MALKLHIPPCLQQPADLHHPPPSEKPLRIQIEGPTVAIERLFPGILWDTEKIGFLEFPQPAGPKLATLTHQMIYGKQPGPTDAVVRDEYLGWILEEPLRRIDYYGVTFDHLVPEDDPNPEVLQINIIEIENDDGVYASQVLPFEVDISEYKGQMVLAVPRCCQKRKGTQDRGRVNDGVALRERRKLGMEGEAEWLLSSNKILNLNH